MTVALLFVEDPGAANFVVGLPGALAALGLDPRVVVAGPAIAYLDGHDVVAEGAGPGVAARLLDDLDPAVVVVGTAENPDTLGLDLVAIARQRRIPTVGVVDGPDNAALRFRGRTEAPLSFRPDWLLVADEWTRQRYLELGFEPDRVVVTGHPNHDRVRAEAAKASKAPTWAHDHVGSAPVVLFAAERSAGLDPAPFRRSSQYTLTGRGLSTGRTEIVMEEFLDAVAASGVDAYAVLRLHPKNTPQEFAPYLHEFDHVSWEQSALEAISAADAVVGMTSMLLEEAVLLGVPTLSIVPIEGQGMLSTSVRLGLTPSVSTRDQVRSAVAELLAAPRPARPEDVERAFPPGGLQRAATVIAEVARA